MCERYTKLAPDGLADEIRQVWGLSRGTRSVGRGSAIP